MGMWRAGGMKHKQKYAMLELTVLEWERNVLFFFFPSMGKAFGRVSRFPLSPPGCLDAMRVFLFLRSPPIVSPLGPIVVQPLHIFT